MRDAINHAGGMTPADRPIRPAPRRRVARAIGIDGVVGAVALILALLLAIWLLPNYVRSPIAPRPLAMAPWFLPAVTTGLIGLAGVMLLARAWRGPATGSEGGTERDRRGLLAAIAAVALYPVLLPRIGALATGVVLTLGLLLTAGVGWRSLLIVGIAVPGLVWLLFSEAIGIPLPRPLWW